MQPRLESNAAGFSTMKGIEIGDESTLRDFLDLQ